MPVCVCFFSLAFFSSNEFVFLFFCSLYSFPEASSSSPFMSLLFCFLWSPCAHVCVCVDAFRLTRCLFPCLLFLVFSGPALFPPRLSHYIYLCCLFVLTAHETPSPTRLCMRTTHSRQNCHHRFLSSPLHVRCSRSSKPLSPTTKKRINETERDAPECKKGRGGGKATRREAQWKRRHEEQKDGVLIWRPMNNTRNRRGGERGAGVFCSVFQHLHLHHEQVSTHTHVRPQPTHASAGLQLCPGRLERTVCRGLRPRA